MNSTCTNITSCILVANDVFPYWSIIMSTILSMVFTAIIGIAISKANGFIVSFLSAMPTGIIFALLGVMLSSYGKDTYDHDVLHFCHIFPIGLCTSSIMYMIWPIIYKFLCSRFIGNVHASRLNRFVLFPLATILSMLFWLITTGLIATVVYFSDMSSMSILILGLSFEVMTLYLTILVFFIPVERSSSSGTINWTIILKVIIVGIIVGACVVLDIYTIPIISGLVGAFPSVKSIILIHVYYSHNYDTFSNISYLMALGNVSVGAFVLTSYYFSIVSHPFVAIVSGLTVCMLIFNVPLLMLYSKYGKRVVTNSY